jgi:hypothetical protein
MAVRNEQVLDRVRQILNEQPGMGSREVFDNVKEMDEEVGKLELASFHARYVLPIKREQARARSDRDTDARAGKKPAGARVGGRRKAAEQDEAGPGLAEGATAAEQPAGAAQPAAAGTPVGKGGRGTRQKQAKQPRGRQAAQPVQQPSAEQPAPQDASSGGREEVRGILMEFALELAEAESRTQVVQALRKVDDYVDRITRSAGK